MNSKQIENREKELNAIIRERNGGSLVGCYAVTTPPEKQELHELAMREMIISIYCYSGKRGLVESMNGHWDEYLVRYVEEIGEERAKEIVREQTAYMEEHAKIHYCTYTDCEGCSYNSIEWS